MNKVWNYKSNTGLTFCCGIICSLVPTIRSSTNSASFALFTIAQRQSLVFRVAPEKDQGALHKCGYPNWAFERAKRTKADKTSKDPAVVSPPETTKKTFITIPYCARISEGVKKICKLFDIATGLKSVNKLRGQLAHVKDKPPNDKQSKLVYGYKCTEPGCSESHIGETKQSLKAWIGQHRCPSSSDCQPDSAVYAHTPGAQATK